MFIVLDKHFASFLTENTIKGSDCFKFGSKLLIYLDWPADRSFWDMFCSICLGNCEALLQVSCHHQDEQHQMGRCRIIHFTSLIYHRGSISHITSFLQIILCTGLLSQLRPALWSISTLFLTSFLVLCHPLTNQQPYRPLPMPWWSTSEIIGSQLLSPSWNGWTLRETQWVVLTPLRYISTPSHFLFNPRPLWDHLTCTLCRIAWSHWWHWLSMVNGRPIDICIISYSG